MAGVWCLLAIPSLLWWSKSIEWIIVISLYANFAAEMAGAEGAAADRSSGDGDA